MLMYVSISLIGLYYWLYTKHLKVHCTATEAMGAVEWSHSFTFSTFWHDLHLNPKTTTPSIFIMYNVIKFAGLVLARNCEMALEQHLTAAHLKAAKENIQLLRICWKVRAKSVHTYKYFCLKNERSNGREKAVGALAFWRVANVATVTRAFKYLMCMR